jgi:hypothetical protein
MVSMRVSNSRQHYHAGEVALMVMKMFLHSENLSMQLLEWVATDSPQLVGSEHVVTVMVIPKVEVP